MPTSQPRLFLSYARADDEPFVKRLYHDLSKHGFEVWWDRESMPSRALTFLHEIRDAIDGADRLLLIVGPGAFQSDYVRAEWDYALSICKVVVPLLRKGDYSILPPELGKLHTIDCRNDGFLNRTYAAKCAELLRILNMPEKTSRQGPG
jgi:hypothetical protein